MYNRLVKLQWWVTQTLAPIDRFSNPLLTVFSLSLFQWGFQTEADIFLVEFPGFNAGNPWAFLSPITFQLYPNM